MECKLKERKVIITGRSAAVEQTKTAAEELRRTLVTARHGVCRPGKLSVFQCYVTIWNICV